jgi:lipopolysaccharide assembly outer membrane protein LptD (OstA)
MTARSLLPIVVLITCLPAVARAAEVRVLSGPGPATTVSVEATPETTIEDRTAGAKPAAGPQGPASTGETFTGELTLFLGGLTISRPEVIEVGDPVVSDVRIFPDVGGALMTVFVRQPVTYSVSRPSALGEIRVELHSKTRPLTVAGVTASGRPRLVTPKPTGEREVAVDAETLSYDREKNTITAHGGVTLTREDTTLTADEVVYDRTNGIAEAHGHVVLTDPQATVEGDFAHLNLEDETGWVENTNTTFHVSNYIVRGQRLDKLGGPKYQVANGVFTTCQCGGLEKPSWTVGGSETNIELQGSGVIHDMIFRVKDVPVLYLPWMMFPANTQRETGLLFPRIGYSNRRGFQYEQPFFWAIDKSTDATVAIDLETAARVGVIGEYRYDLSQAAHGAFVAAYYNESLRKNTNGVETAQGLPADIPQDRFAFAGHHVQPFYGKSKFYLDLFAVSDELFLREINTFAFAARNEVAFRTARFTTSRTGVYKGWGDGMANVEAAYYQDLIDPQKLVPQKLPRLDAEQSTPLDLPLLGNRLVGRVNGQAIDYQREKGFGGLRGDLAPDLFFPFNIGRYVHGSVDGLIRETAYHLTDGEQVAFAVPNSNVPLLPGFVAAGKKLPDLATDHTRALAEVQGRVGMEFDRVFTFEHLGLEKVRHTIEPEVQYLFVPGTHRQFDQTKTTIDCGKLPGGTPGTQCGVTLFGAGYLFDDRDAVNRRNFVSYGLTTRLLGRPATPEETAARAAASAPTAEKAAPPAEKPEAPAETPLAPPMSPLDPDTLPQGLPMDAVPGFVGPPTAPATGTQPALPPSREVVRASILHGYDISRTLVGDSHQSDVDFALRVAPLDWIGLSSNTTVSIQDKALRGTSLGLVAHEPGYQATAFQAPTTAGISYRFIEKSVNQSTQTLAEQELLQTDGVNEVDGSFYLRLNNYLGLAFLSRYSFNDTPEIASNGTVTTGVIGPHFLERDYFVRLVSRCNCWVLEAGLADKFNPDERLFRLQFTLIGLGSFGQSPLNRNYVGFAPLNALGFSRPGIGPSAVERSTGSGARAAAAIPWAGSPLP